MVTNFKRQECKMSRSIEGETLAREIIKPFSPTPNHLRNLKLSLLDQIIPVEYTAVILFYRGTAFLEAVPQLGRRRKTKREKGNVKFHFGAHVF